MEKKSCLLVAIATLFVAFGSVFAEDDVSQVTLLKMEIGESDDIVIISGTEASVNVAWNRAVGSSGSLKSYCLERSVIANINVGGGEDVVAISNANRSVWVYCPDPLKLAQEVSNQELGFGVVSGSNEGLLKSCQFFDNDGRVMFYGYAEGKIIQSGDSKTPVWKDLVMKLPGTVRMSLPEEYAWGYVYLRYTDENGNQQYTYLGYGSEFYFPSAFAGLKGARLLIRGYTPDGYNIDQVVDLGSGNFLPIDEFKEGFNSLVMEGITYCKDEVVNTIESQNSVGESPLFQLESTGVGSTLVSVRTSEGEYPKGFYYRQIGGEGEWAQWKYEKISYPGVVREKFVFPAGTYHIDFDWENFHSESWKDMQWWQGYFEGGKG